MSDLLPILDAVLHDAQSGHPVALCSIVRTSGSTPQSPGATMLVRSDFTTLGTLGGGCVEAEVRKQAFQLLQSNQSGMLEFVLNHDYGWDDGLICGGRMHVGVSPLTPKSDLAPFRQALENARLRKPAYFPVFISNEGTNLEYRVNLEVPPTLLIAGAGHVGQALAKLAVDLDFHVIVIDDRADFASPHRFPSTVELVTGDIAASLRQFPIDEGCLVVIVTRGHAHDHQALDAVIRGPAGYIGLIGSRRKSTMILKDLAAAGVPPEQIARVHTPIGLPIGAITVPEIAVSIVAELVKARRAKQPVPVVGPLECAKF